MRSTKRHSPCPNHAIKDNEYRGYEANLTLSWMYAIFVFNWFNRIVISEATLSRSGHYSLALSVPCRGGDCIRLHFYPHFRRLFREPNSNITWHHSHDGD